MAASPPVRVLLFLDVDGVLNSGETRDRQPEPTAEHDLAAVATADPARPTGAFAGLMGRLGRVLKSGKPQQP